MVSIKKKVNTSLMLVPLCLLLFSCNESEFYEKQYLDDGTIGEKINLPSTILPPAQDIPPAVTIQPPATETTPPVVVTQPPSEEITPLILVIEGPPVTEPIPPVIVITEPTVEPEAPIAPEEPEIKLIEVNNDFTQNLSKKGKVDILWVVDDSGSMSDEQKALAFNFDIFIHEFIEKKVDFKMAITTTDATSGRRYRVRGGKYYTSPTKNGKMVGNPHDLTSEAAAKNESKFYKDFARYINVGTRGSGREKGLHTSLSFLKRYGQTFFRKDAYTIIVYVSDEEDQSPQKVNEYVKAYQDTKSNVGMVKIYSIVTKKKSRRWETIGTRYMAASEATGGTSAHIKGDFYTILRDMGGKIVNLIDSFALSQQPYDDKILVLVAGQEADPVTYDYDNQSRTVKFKKSFLPSEGANITVSYQVEDKNGSILLGSN